MNNDRPSIRNNPKKKKLVNDILDFLCLAYDVGRSFLEGEVVDNYTKVRMSRQYASSKRFEYSKNYITWRNESRQRRSNLLHASFSKQRCSAADDPKFTISSPERVL